MSTIAPGTDPQPVANSMFCRGGTAMLPANQSEILKVGQGLRVLFDFDFDFAHGACNKFDFAHGAACTGLQ